MRKERVGSSRLGNRAKGLLHTLIVLAEVTNVTSLKASTVVSSLLSVSE
jgi:hypothetical protein